MKTFSDQRTKSLILKYGVTIILQNLKNKYLNMSIQVLLQIVIDNLNILFMNKKSSETI